MVVRLSAPSITPSLKFMAMLSKRQIESSMGMGNGGTNMDVPRLDNG